MAEAAAHIPATLVRGVLIQELLARDFGLAVLHAVQAQTIEGELRFSDSDVDGVLEVVEAGTGIAGRGFRGELKFLKLIDDLGKRILLDSLINWPALECHERILVVERSLLAAGASGTVELIEREVQLSIKDGLDVGTSGCKRT